MVVKGQACDLEKSQLKTTESIVLYMDTAQ